MSISGINNNYGQSYYNTAKEGQSGRARQVVKNNKTEETSVSDAKKENSAAAGVDTQQYLVDLQKKNPQINLIQGNENTGKTSNSNSKTDVMIAPSILKQMASDPAAAKKYGKMLSDIPALDRWADSMIHSMTGSEVKYRQVWIDEDGNMGSFCITGPSEATKKAEEKEKRNEKIKEQREKQKELLERLRSRDKTSLEEAYMKSILKLTTVNYRA